MNKGKNKGKIQKSRQNAEGREAGSFLGKAFDSYHKFLSNKVINFVINMILAIGTVLPFMMKMCNKVAFTYEVNDDAAIVQILDGSYTGTPDGLMDAANFVATFQNRQGLQVSCIEEIAYKRGFINKEQLKKLGTRLRKTPYGQYILSLCKEPGEARKQK